MGVHERPLLDLICTAKFIYTFLVLNFVYGECPEGCDPPERIYEELKCTPVYKRPYDCCPIKYDCSVLDENRVDTCVLRGKFYWTGEQIPSEETYPNCRIGCSCKKAPSQFLCAVLDCPEWQEPTESGCRYKYELNECCAVGEVCPPFNDIKCIVDGETILEGQRFTPPDQKCVTCVCKKGFNGAFIEPFCKKETCVTELDYSEEISKFCAAVYLPNGCCPFEWICPNGNDKIIPAEQGTSNIDLLCNYGNYMLLNVGDKFVRDGIPCECKVPPFVTCRKEYSQM